jgi:RND family efflux transporter MFP subunit
MMRAIGHLWPAGLLAALLAVAAGPASAPAQAQDDGGAELRGSQAVADEPALQRLLETQDEQRAAGELGRHEARALVEPRAEAVLSSEIGGRIERLPYDEGDRFAKGDVLVGFDCSFHQAELASARADLTKALRTLENNRQLAELNSIGQLEVALAEADVAKARAQVRLRDLYVDRCRLTAPFDGRVVERPVNAHETVGKDQELMSVIAVGGLRLRLIVPSSWLAWLEPGQGFRLQVDETGQTYAAEVETIGARIDPVSQTLPILGRLTGPAAPADLLPGMSGTARFEPNQG